MVQKKDFNNFHKQIFLSNQKHKCQKCGIRFNNANLPKFEYKDGHTSNNATTNLQVLHIDCFDLGKFQ